MTTKPEKRFRLINARLACRMTQEEVAAHFKVHVSTVMRHEKGQSKLTLTWLERYARLYRVKKNELIDEDDGGKPVETIRAAHFPVYGVLGNDYRVMPAEEEQTIEVGSHAIAAGKLEFLTVSEALFPIFSERDLIAIDTAGKFKPKLCINRHCIIELHRGLTVYGTLQRGKDSSSYNILPPHGQLLENRKVINAYPVKAILKSY